MGWTLFSLTWPPAYVNQLVFIQARVGRAWAKYYPVGISQRQSISRNLKRIPDISDSTLVRLLLSWMHTHAGLFVDSILVRSP